jgi:hypothetical protein
MVLGVLFGVWISKYLPGIILRSVFALFCLALALKMFFQTNTLLATKEKPQGQLLFLLCFLAGTLSGILGIGGGVLVIPLLLWVGLPMPQVSATAAACALPTALAGALSAIILGWSVAGLPSHTLGFVYWPGALIMGAGSLVGVPVGVYLVGTLSVRRVQIIFAVLLLILAWQIFPK